MKKQKTLAYKNIINNQIKDSDLPHPLDNIKDKKIFIDLFKQSIDISNLIDLSKGKNNMFNFTNQGIKYNLFIEHPDGGGEDITRGRPRKKVSIPSNKTFKKIIENNERVLIMNVYIPLNSNFELDFNNLVYLIIDPKVIYKSEVIINKTFNPSSRWVTLNEILNVIENKTYILNKSKNVFIVYKDNLAWFFENILKYEYINMLENEIIKINTQDLKDENTKNYKKYRRLFREILILSRGIECEIISCKIAIQEIMIASHIKPVNKIINDEKLDKLEKITEIKDPNNGFILCPNHDAIFDKFLITFNNEGLLKISKNIINQISDFNLIENRKSIHISDKKTIKYLKFHNNEFKYREK